MFKRFGVLPGLYFDASADKGAAAETEETEDPAPEEKDGKSKGLAQADVDKLVGAARKQGGTTAVTKLFEGFGVKDADELKNLVEAARKADADKLTDKEKLEKALADAKKTADDEKKAADDKVVAAMKRVQDTEIKIAASQAIVGKDGKVTRPAFRSEALEDILLLIDRSKITETDGKFEGIEDAVEALAKSKPYLLPDERQQGSGKGSPGGESRRQVVPSKDKKIADTTDAVKAPGIKF